MELKDYKKNKNDLICIYKGNIKRKTPYSLVKEEKIIDQFEEDYLKKRNNLIKKVDKIEKDCNYDLTSSKIMCIIAFIVSLIYLYMELVLHSFNPLIFILGPSLIFGSAFWMTVAAIKERKAEKIVKHIIYNDMVIKNGRKLKDKKNKQIIKQMNPKLFEIINKSKLSRPINVTTKFTDNEKDLIYDIIKEIINREKREEREKIIQTNAKKYKKLKKM